MAATVLDDIVMPYDNVNFIIKPWSDAPPNITFTQHGNEIMRITRAGVFVNPDVNVDDAASAVIAALDQYIRTLVASKDAEIYRLRAELSQKEDE